MVVGQRGRERDTERETEREGWAKKVMRLTDI